VTCARGLDASMQCTYECEWVCVRESFTRICCVQSVDLCVRERERERKFHSFAVSIILLYSLKKEKVWLIIVYVEELVSRHICKKMF